MFVVRKGSSSAAIGRRFQYYYGNGNHLSRSLWSGYRLDQVFKTSLRYHGSDRMWHQLASQQRDEEDGPDKSSPTVSPTLLLEAPTTSIIRRQQFMYTYHQNRRARSQQFYNVFSNEQSRSRSSFASPSAYQHLVATPLSSSLGIMNHQQGGNIRFFSAEPPPPPTTSSYKTSAKIPTPKSSSANASPLAKFHPRVLLKSAMETTWNVTKAVLTFLLKLPENIFFYISHPKERAETIADIKAMIRKEVDHYWQGAKLLTADVRTARSLLAKTLSGSTLTRRERKQLLRTVSDMFRVVPFSMFIIIPAGEVFLPFALRIFPNMMPSTFQDSLKAEEGMKRELQSRIAMAHFFSDTLEELAKEQKRIVQKRDSDIALKQEESASSLLDFLERARNGEMMPPDVIVQYANYFQDDLTLDNMPRMQLINMCKYMGIPPYGADSFLRFQLRHRIRILKEDDQRILWEGIDSLTKMELREACQERGMRSMGLSKEAYKRSLQQWLDLSVNKNVPISLLIMSRIFFLQEEMITPATSSDESSSVASLADAISGLDKEVLNEVILEVATSEEKKSNPDVRKIKLEVLAHQNEKIREEQAEREAAEKKKKTSEKIEDQLVEESLATVEAALPPEATEKVLAALDEAKEFDGKSVTIKVDLSDVTTGEEKIETTTSADVKPEAEEEKGESELSADEMDALTQLISADPVSKEREELARIKSSMKAKGDEEEALESPNESYAADFGTKKEDFDPMVSPDQAIVISGDESAAAVVETTESKAARETRESTVFSKEGEIPHPQSDSIVERADSLLVDGEDEPEEVEDPVVARLKKRIESMVDKIEVQLSDVQIKIGDKLHILDRDMDGILSREEMAGCLQQVLKRNITFDEAMEIASEMDENKDGVFTVQELLDWVETNKLVKFHSEGRDADMDRIIENHTPENLKEKPDENEAKSAQ